MRKFSILFLSLLILISAFAAAGSIVIDFEELPEYYNLSALMTPYGDVGFYMTDFQPLKTLDIGDTASLDFSGRYPIVAENNTKIAAFIVGKESLDDVVVSDPQGTGAGGKTLTDPLTEKDYYNNDVDPSKRHAYSNYEAIVVDVSNLKGNVLSINFAMIDLDHKEDWYILYFDKDYKLIYKIKANESIWGYGNGAAYPVNYNYPGASAVAIWAESTDKNPEYVGYSIDNIEIEIEEDLDIGITGSAVKKGTNPRSALNVLLLINIAIIAALVYVSVYHKKRK